MWHPVAVLSVSAPVWSYTDPIKGDIFRFKLLDRDFASVQIKQAQLIGGATYWSDRELILSREFKQLRFAYPPTFQERRLALRLYGAGWAENDSASVAIEVDDGTGLLYSQPWQPVTLLNGWQAWRDTTTDTLGLTVPGYYQDPYGVVHIQGVIAQGAIGSPIFILPPSCCPNRYLIFPVVCGSSANPYLTGVVHVKQSGEVTLTAGANTYVALDPISFRVS